MGEPIDSPDTIHAATDARNKPKTWPPTTLEAWRTFPSDIPDRLGHARSLWDPLESFFEEKGYLLFVIDNAQYDVTRPPHEIRKPDPYHVFIGEPEPSRFWCVRNKLCGAVRPADGTHVVLQLLAINEDGKDEIEIQKRLHRTPISTEYTNRAVPLLDLITFTCDTGNLVFGVFPLLCPGFITPGPGDATEAFETVRQMFEAIAYLHANLVAHLVYLKITLESIRLTVLFQDIGKFEFLLNYGGSATGRYLANRTDRTIRNEFWPGDFLKYFNYQWMITDFDVSVMYDPRSAPEDRLVTGLCGGKVSGDLDNYPKVWHISDTKKLSTDRPFMLKMLGPEVWKESNIGKPYCPFKHDVYQISRMLLDLYPKLASAYPGYKDILVAMCADDPRERPHMSSVLLRYNDYLASLTRDDLCRLTVVDLIQSGNWPDHVAAAQARRAEQTPW